MIVYHFEVHHAFAEDMINLREEHRLLLSVVMNSRTSWADFVISDATISNRLVINPLNRRINLLPFSWLLHFRIIRLL